MAEVKFEDNSVQVKNAIEDQCIQWLYEVAGEIRSQAQRNSRVDTGQLKGSWDYRVDEGDKEATIGSALENAIWEEFGTGEYAVKQGRSGYWVYVKGSGNTKSSSPKSYSLEGAKQAVAMLRSKGLDAHYTKGKKPNRTLERAFTTVKPKAQAAAEKLLKGGLK